LKHANYVSFGKCQRGSTIDRCDMGPRVYRRFPVEDAFHVLPYARYNWHLIPPRRAGSPHVNPDILEDFYSNGRFNGWQSAVWGDAPPRYGEILRQFGIFPSLGTGSGPPPDCSDPALITCPY